MTVLQQLRQAQDAYRRFEVCDSDLLVQGAQLGGSVHEEFLTHHRHRFDPASCDSSHRENLACASLVLFDPQCDCFDHHRVMMILFCRRLPTRQTRWYP